MKNFIFIIIAGVCLSAFSPVKAQTNINLEKVNQKPTNNYSLKFIDGIEFKPGASTVQIVEPKEKAVETVKVVSEPAAKEIVTSSNLIEQAAPWQFKYAMMTDRDVESLTNTKLYSFIDEWWATRYQYGGSTKSGIDCSAFTGTLFKDVYIQNLPRTAKEQYAACYKVFSKDDLVEGDLVFFNTRGGVSHVGVYLGNHYFVHSGVSDGVTISSLDDKYYSARFICGGKLKTMVDQEDAVK
ncbi:MAG: C40 family peptidase [Bacteroidota bacterium]